MAGFVALHCAPRARRRWPAEIAEALAWLVRAASRTLYEDAATRQADLLQLEQIAAGYPSRERFLTELTLDPPDATSDQAGAPLLDEDYLILSTIHSAKGQEWKSVFVLNVRRRLHPLRSRRRTTAEIEEERRLLYVAMTRAKDQLHLSCRSASSPMASARSGDRHVYASRTRFIPARCCITSSASPGRAAAAERRAAVADGPKVDLAARMRAMWR